MEEKSIAFAILGIVALIAVIGFVSVSYTSETGMVTKQSKCMSPYKLYSTAGVSKIVAQGGTCQPTNNKAVYCCKVPTKMKLPSSTQQTGGASQQQPRETYQ